MTVAAAILDRAQESLGESLPRIAGAFLVLIGGLIAAWLLSRIAARLLSRVGLDQLAERLAVHDVLERVGLPRSLSAVVARAIRLALIVVTILAAVSLLGVGALSEALNAVVLFLPKLFVALAILLIGVVAARFVGDRVAAFTDQLDLGGPLPELARGTVLVLAVLTALAQVGVPTFVLVALLAIIVTAIALTLALAFGLGGRDVARQLSAGRYVRQSFELGQRIAVGEATGTIRAFEGTATVLDRDDGGTVRVPNQQLIDGLVVVAGVATPHGDSP
jgi:small-conductance mechanosensitive channel